MRRLLTLNEHADFSANFNRYGGSRQESEYYSHQNIFYSLLAERGKELVQLIAKEKLW
jgi:hypothetical protein